MKTYKCETHRMVYEIDDRDPQHTVTKHTHTMRPVPAQCYLLTHPEPEVGEHDAMRTMAGGRRIRETCRIVELG